MLVTGSVETKAASWNSITEKRQTTFQFLIKTSSLSLIEFYVQSQMQKSIRN